MRDFKIKVTPEESEVIQKLLFLAGYSWRNTNNINVKDTDKPFLYFDEGILTWSNLESTFYSDIYDNPEITFEEFVNEIELELNNK